MITKRAFLMNNACDTAGWYAMRAEPGAPGAGLEWRFHVGAEIGRLARKQLGPGTLLPFAPTETALQATSNAMGNPDSALLFEATFVAGEFIARADGLRRNGDGWDVIEVKSAVAPEDGDMKDEHIDDLAYTTFVAMAAGVAVVRCALMLLDPECRLGTESLVERDVTDAVLHRAAEFAARAPSFAAACAAVDRPPPTLEFICKKCEFFATHCIGKDIPDPLFLLPRLSEKRFDAMKQYERLSAVPPGPDLTGPQHRVFSAIRSGAPLVDRSALARLRELTWPVYYLDFEAVQPGLPWFVESAPYEVLPFQYSIHRREQPGHEVTHAEYLAPIGGDWRRDIVIALIEALGRTGSIVVYSSYEKQRLTAMAAQFPEFEPELRSVIDRLVDLEPIVRNGYCHPEFLGRTSIKFVLPVVAPEMSYADLDVGNGEDAAGLFALMTVGQRDPADQALHRRQLLEYCRQDTMAMVKLHDALAAI